MKKFFSVLFSIVIVISLILLAINMSIQDMAIDTIHDSLVKKKISNTITDVIIERYPNIDVSDLEGLNNTIQNSPEAREITEKYFDDIIKEITSGESTISVVIETDLENLIDNHKEELSSYGIDLEELDAIKEEVLQDNNMNEIYEIVREQLPTTLTKEQQMVIDVYQILHSKVLQYSLFGILAVSVLAIILINWSSKVSLKYLSVSTFLSGIIVQVGLIGGIKWIQWQLTNHILGRTTDIHYSSLSYIGLSYLGIGLLLFVVFIVLKKTNHSIVK